MDDWQLPVTETVGACQVGVRMARFSSPEEASWMGVKEAAVRVNERCRVRGALMDVTGGWTTVGLHGWIEVVIERCGSGSGVEGWLRGEVV